MKLKGTICLALIAVFFYTGCSANKESELLVSAAKDKDYKTMAEILPKANNLNVKNEDGYSAIYYLTNELISSLATQEEYKKEDIAKHTIYQEALDNSPSLKIGSEEFNKMSLSDMDEEKNKLENLRDIAKDASEKYFGYSEYRISVLELLHTMVSRGAQLEAKLGNGKSVVDIAKEKSPDDVFKLFEKWLAQL